MKEHVYRTSTKRIIGQSFIIWLFVGLQVAANIWTIPKFLSNGQYWGIILVNVILSFLSFPGVYIFFNYMKHSAHKDFILMYNSIKMVDGKNNTAVEIVSTEIERIEFHQSLYPYSVVQNQLPWSNHEYFCFIDKNGKKIFVTCYIMDISQLWLDTLSRRISSDKLVKSESIFPTIKD